MTQAHQINDRQVGQSMAECLMVLAGLTAALAFGMPASANAQSLRWIVQGHPDAPNTLKLLETRLNICQGIESARGKHPSDVKFPSLSEISKTVSNHHEMLIDGDWQASFSATGVIVSDISSGCQFRVQYTRTASVERKCVHDTAGSSTPALLGSAEPDGKAPSIQTETESDAKTCQALKAEKLKVKSYDDVYTKGVTPGGHACVWLGNPGNPKAPNVPGKHFCLHPRFMTGEFDKWSLNPPPLWSVDIPWPDDNGVLERLSPDINRGNAEAVLVEEGKPIDKARFTAAAVMAFISQPNWKPVGSAP